MQADVISAVRAVTAESPVWDDQRGCLWWIDIQAGWLSAYNGETPRNAVCTFNEEIGSVALREEGGLVVTGESVLRLLDDHLVTQKVVPIGTSRPGFRTNDCKVDACGRLWTATMNVAGKADGAVYCVENANGRVDVKRVIDAVSIPNGIDWSPENDNMYFVDTVLGRIDIFDYDLDAGKVSKRRPFVQVHSGRPDGLTVDSAGNVWVALYGGGGVDCYSPKGKLLRTISVPASRVTSCTFGGPNLMDLFVTSASKGMTTPELIAEPLAGFVFRYADVAEGRLARRFAA